MARTAVRKTTVNNKDNFEIIRSNLLSINVFTKRYIVVIQPAEEQTEEKMPTTTRRTLPTNRTRKPLANKNLVDGNDKPTTTSSNKDDEIKALKAELAKKDSLIATLTGALNKLTIAEESVENATTGDGGKLTTSSKKTVKDPNAPVPAKTAYKFFCQHNTNEIENGDAIDMRKVWKDSDAETRARYVAMANADKTRYGNELKSYNDGKDAMEQHDSKEKQDPAMVLTEDQRELGKTNDAGKKKKKTTKKDPDAPKQPISSFIFFSMENREIMKEKNPNASPTEVSKLLGEEWHKIKADKNGTKKYDELAAKDKTRYETEKKDYEAMVAERDGKLEEEKKERLKQDQEEAMKIFQANKTEGTATAAVVDPGVDDLVAEDSKKKKATKQKTKKDPNAPKKPKTAYLEFCNENREIIKAQMPQEATHKEFMQEIGRQWKELPDSKRAKYNTKAELDKIRYDKETALYTAEEK